MFLRRLISNKGTKSLTGFFATFYARRTFGNSAAPKIASCLVGQFWGLNTDCILQPLLRRVVLSQNGSPHGVYHWTRLNRRIRRLSTGRQRTLGGIMTREEKIAAFGELTKLLGVKTGSEFELRRQSAKHFYGPGCGSNSSASGDSLVQSCVCTRRPIGLQGPMGCDPARKQGLFRPMGRRGAILHGPLAVRFRQREGRGPTGTETPDLMCRRPSATIYPCIRWMSVIGHLLIVPHPALG
jgi:hypothetical protein